MKEKDTITPLARGIPNGVLTQVPTEARREAAERLRRTQEMEFTPSTTIQDVLFKGRARVKEKKLNDFLTRELDGRGVVATSRSVLLKEFSKDPNKYIRDKGALKEIQISDAYARMERAVREEMDLEEVVSKLSDKGVSNLLGWSEAAASVKKTVHEITKQSLDAALLSGEESNDDYYADIPGGTLRVCVQCELASCGGNSWWRGDGNGSEGGETETVMDVQRSWQHPRKG
ncbi:retrotransposon hot spot (RHS) protein [Trypanosoma cruzi Dm28c]|uniref:Retrotransposon hot spot (RHS) protein n=2 Tax=Trypanosoma cruzi TaxID=5693 RepID=V5D2G6_TRYCR|nr:retrotransposon hot spot (RHS) protein [Trypanosoma cruzi Dm28c]PWU83168.1 putative retrotransposon hot spot protein (RHS,) [Trypanosoma cruzi]